MFDYSIQPIFSYTAQLAQPLEVIGPVPEGIRINFYVTGGSVQGERLSGRLRPVGGDWFLLRRDGVGELDVRATIETDDGALIDVSYRGLSDIGPDAYEQFLRGEQPKTITLRTAPRMRTAHPAYQWVHRVLCFAVGEADLESMTVSYDVYAVK